jgi:hypothetical protein
MHHKQNDTERRALRFVGLLALILFSALSYLGIRTIQPPKAVPEDAPTSEFSSGRAMKHLGVIAQRPHPMGSIESENVRNYLIKELASLSLNPEVQRTTVVSHWAKQRGFTLVPAATVINVLGWLKGTENTKAVLLVAHYDSVPTAPGASDDGAAVAAILETLRALKAGPPLRNDVICLFTDGEEVGLFGAKAFVDEHPWAKDVGVVLNLEARGASGPSFMFETSENNGWLIQEFARAAPYPVASSLMYEIYQRMPNDTDMTVFKTAGYSGLNFSYVDSLNHYHTLLDSVSEIDERSLQHHGTYALALARHFGNLDLTKTRATDAVYFNIFGRLVHYSQKWVSPLTALNLLLYVALVAVGLRRKRLTISVFAQAVLALLINLIGAAIVVTLIWWIIGWLHHGYRWIPYGDTYNSGIYKLSFVFFTVAVVTALHVWSRKKLSSLDLMTGALFWWVVLLVITTLLMPAGSYLFAWPLLFSLGATIIASRDSLTESINAFVMLLGAIPGVILLSSMIYMLFATISINMPALVISLLVLLLGLLVWQIELVARINRWGLPMASAVTALVLTIAGIATARFDSHHRKANSIQYSLHADSGTAVWNCFDDAPDEWTSQFISVSAKKVSLAADYPWISHEALQNPAPLMATLPPKLDVQNDTVNGGVRTLRMRIVSQRQAPMILVRTDSDTKILGAVINGNRVASDANAQSTLSGKWRMIYAAPPAEGFELILEVPPTEPLQLIVEDVSYELPVIPAMSIKERPNYMMPAPLFGASDSTLVSKTFRLN